MRAVREDERRPGRGSGVGVGVSAGSTNPISVPREQVAAERRRVRREQQFSADVAVFLAGLDRRRAAERRLQPLVDLERSA